MCVCREEEEVGMDILDEVGVNLQVRRSGDHVLCHVTGCFYNIGGDCPVLAKDCWGCHCGQIL